MLARKLMLNSRPLWCFEKNQPFHQKWRRAFVRMRERERVHPPEVKAYHYRTSIYLLHLSMSITGPKNPTRHSLMNGWLFVYLSSRCHRWKDVLENKILPPSPPTKQVSSTCSAYNFFLYFIVVSCDEWWSTESGLRTCAPEWKFLPAVAMSQRSMHSGQTVLYVAWSAGVIIRVNYCCERNIYLFIYFISLHLTMAAISNHGLR